MASCFTEQGITVWVEEEVSVVLPEALMNVHARAIILEKWLRHKGRRHAVGDRYVLNDVLVEQQLIAHLSEGLEPHVDFSLTRSSDLVMMHLDVNPSFDHLQNHLGPEILETVKGRHRKVAFLVAWTVA